MKSVFAMLLVVLVGSVGAKRNKIGFRTASLYMMQATGHYKGADITFGSDSIWHVTDYEGNRTYAKGIWVSDSSAGGHIKLHLVDDDSLGVLKWVTVELEAGDIIGFVFDRIYQVGTVDSLPRVDFIVLE